MKWVSRSDLAKAVPSAAPGSILFSDEPAEYGVPLASAELEALQGLSRETLRKTGLAKNDRVLFALRRDGAPSVALLAQAVSPLVSSVAATGPKGRLRLLSTIRTLKPTTLVTTPCGAADFLARLYLEFNVDPVELDLRKIILVGEIASPGVAKRVAKEFEAEVAQIYCDPIFGAALASGGKDGWETADGKYLGLAAPNEAVLTEGLAAAGSGGAREIVLCPTWSTALGDLAIRTGQLVAAKPGDAGLFDHTVGEHVLVRGQWISLPLLRRQLGFIDGISGWTLTLDRGDRTLDSARLDIGFARETLVSNPMWKARIQQAVAAATPIQVEVVTSLQDQDTPAEPGAVVDLRGHHLGVDRNKVAGA